MGRYFLAPPDGLLSEAVLASGFLALSEEEDSLFSFFDPST
jgi:hypothetical protein